MKSKQESHVNKLLNLTLTSIGAIFLATACSKSSDQNIQAVFKNDDSSSETQKFQKSEFDINAYPLTKLVCDPFNGDETPSPKHGIKSNLWFRGLNQPRFYSVMDYINKTTKSEQNLFFNSINVPTRVFSTGFPLETGGVVKDDSGNQLIEYFAMKYSSQITLSDTDTEGTYELALLSDDGSILNIKDPTADGVIPTTWSTLINNDGDTPTRMKCSSKLIDFKKGKRVPMELFYYQGPRYHIANMLIWRKATQAGKDTLCNQSGNNLFFDPNQNSKPYAWHDLELRGWKALAPENYLLPEEDQIQSNVNGDVNYNACYQGEIPVITDFRTVEVLSTDISFSWNTDIPSSGLLLITNLDTGEKITTQTDNLLKTNHVIMVTGLMPQTNYRFQAVSISNTLGRAISQAIELQTF